MATRPARLALLAMLLLTQGCERNLCVADGGSCPKGEVEPTSARLPLLGKVRFMAAAPVTWSLLEESGAGTIDADGFYTAPFARGTFHVLAFRDGAEVGRVPVTVGPEQLEVAAGWPGSTRSVDGPGTEARIGTVKGWLGDGEGNAYFSESVYGREFWEYRGAAIRRFGAGTGSVSTLATFDSPEPTCLAQVGDKLWAARGGDIWEVDRATGASRLLLPGVRADNLIAEPGAVYVRSAGLIMKVDPSTLATTPIMDATEFAGYVKPEVGSNATNVRFSEMTGIGPGRFAVLFRYDGSYPNGDVYAGAQVASLDVATRQVASVYELNGSFVFYAYRGLLARERPQPGYPNAFEWQLAAADNYAKRKNIYSLVGYPELGGSGPSTSGMLSTCSALRGDLLCGGGFSLSGEPLGEVAGLAYHPDGLIAADKDHHAIRLLDPRLRPGTLVVSTLAGSYGGPAANGPLLAARFDTPSALAAIDDHTLLAVDLSDSQAMRLIDLSDGQVRTVYHDGFLGENVSGPYKPWIIEGLAARDGHVFASLPAGHIIYEFDPTSSPWRRVGLWGYSPEAATVDGPPGTARFESPRGLTTDPAGNIYVADSGSGRIRKIDRAGDTSTIASGLSAPTAVAWAGENLLVVAEPTRLLRLDLASGARSTLSDTGWQHIASIAHHPAGVLYVADSGDRRVRAIETATGAILDLAGNPSREVVIPGPLPGALAQPAGLAVLPSGDVYVTDALDHALMRLH